MSNVLVIGYGNTLRGDDAAGVHAAELIAQRHPKITCVYLHQLVPEVAEQIAECDVVFFIDAQKDITEANARLIAPSVEADQPRTHFISPESLLALSQQLYQHLPAKAYVVGIPASQFEFSEELSASTKIGVDESVQIVNKILNEFHL
ncbi:MAG: hydrogenase maturation protease [Ignavibacteriales bacterium]|nr:hydrogenase maturation protease [Ignavibacteriales bacterium]